MSIPSHFRINVARAHPTRKAWGSNPPTPEYHHLFDTGTSLVNESDMVDVLTELRARFPEPEFKITVINWRVSGTRLEV